MTFALDERSGERFVSLEAAQRAGLQAIASAIARAVRAGLEDGRYAVKGGIVVPADPTTRSVSCSSISGSLAEMRPFALNWNRALVSVGKRALIEPVARAR